jgi:hypothetical protein
MLAALCVWAAAAQARGEDVPFVVTPGRVLGITQRYQQIQIDFASGMASLGAALHGLALRDGAPLAMRVVDGPVRRMQVGTATGTWSGLTGMSFTAAGTGGCK